MPLTGRTVRPHKENIFGTELAHTPVSFIISETGVILWFFDRLRKAPVPKAPEPSSTCQNTTKSLPRISPKSYCYNAVPNRFLAHFSTSRTNGPRLLSLPKAGTHSPFREKSHTRAHTPKQGCFGWGWYHYSRSVPHVHQHPRAGYQNGKFCRFWGLVGGAPKERRKPSEQRCAYARRCSEASRPRWAA